MLPRSDASSAPQHQHMQILYNKASTGRYGVRQAISHVRLTAPPSPSTLSARLSTEPDRRAARWRAASRRSSYEPLHEERPRECGARVSPFDGMCCA